MPELPEVEVARRHLEGWLAGQTVTAVELLDDRGLHGGGASIVGRRCLRWRRRGKVLLGDFEGGLGLLSHLGMTGKWVRTGTVGDPRPYRRIVIGTGSAGGVTGVAMVDPRRFGRAWFDTTTALESLPQWADLGPDMMVLAQAFDAGEQLAAVFGRSASPLKRRLLDQKRVAGMGNIAVVEACWRARIHPHVSCSSLNITDWQRLAEAALAHFKQVIEVEGQEELVYVSERRASNPFLVYGRAAEPCPRCTSTLVGGQLSKRPSVWCPVCQPTLD